ncbi:hypothetical protein CDL12_11220 [Handroanthus impetiginosus]|uniref:Uncharacterized protein n=1 Tax=Handroanthus impetiginosus TaxID=429701 RepID=A0A2G9HF51_9LAMI|nr:hypothetical protein CDL12_11220 [Handroanthus impetiginosus]
MKKLTLKHQEEIQEFHRTWEEKRLKLETDHKLESAFIRSMHGQGSLRMEKLKLLEDNFAKKIEEHILLKDVQLNDLKAKQSAALNEESLKAAFWQARGKALYGKLKAASQSPGSQSGDNVLGLQPTTCINAAGPGDVFNMPEQHWEHQTPGTSSDIRRNDIAASVTSTSEPSDASRETPFLGLATVNSQNESGVMSLERSSLAVVEHLSQSKHSTDHGETVNANLPAPVRRVSDEIRSVDLTEFPTELPKTVYNEVMGHVDPVELSDASKTKSDKASKITQPDVSLNQRDGPDEEASCDLDAPSQHPEQTVAVPDCCDLFQTQVQQDNMGQNLVSSELHGLDASAAEGQSTSRVEMRTSELLETVSALPTTAEAPVTDEMVTPVPSDYEAPVAENSGQLDPVSVEAHLNCNESAAIEDHDLARSSPQTVEPRGREVLSHDSISLGGETLEVPSNQLDLGPLTTVAHGQGIESSGVSQNDVGLPQLVNAAERLSQSFLQLGINAGHHRGPNNLSVHPTHQPISWNSTPSLLADPLQNELERIRKETEQLEKNQQDMMSQLNSDCEKEIQEIITQIRKKYEVKLQETEAEFRFKKNEIDKNQNKVLMNKILAEAFRSKCQDLRPSGLPSMQQGLMHNLHQLSLPPSTRPSASQLASRHPALQATVLQQQQQISQPHSVRAVQSITAPHVQQHAQAVQHSPASFSGTSSRPPVISAITPAGNPRVGGDVRSPAPHLQFRPIVAASSIPTATTSSVPQPLPSQVLPSQSPPEGPPAPPPPPPPPPSTNWVYQSRCESTPGLVADTNYRTSSPLPEIYSTFRPLEQSDLEMLGNVECDQTSAAAADVVCLSDDD